MAITGRRPRIGLFRNAYQEIDHFPPFDPVTKYSVPVDSPEQFQFLLRSGHTIGETRDTTLSPNIGVVAGTNAISDPDPISINILSWTQGFADNKLAVTVGKFHPNQYIDLSPVANDESRQFLAAPFDGNNAIPILGGYTPGVVLQVMPSPDWYVHVVSVDSLGTPTTGLDTLDEGKFTSFAEFGVTPAFTDDLKGHFRFIGFYADNATGSAPGFAINFDLTYKDTIVPFVRYAWNDGGVATFRQQFSAGLAFIKPFNRKDDMFGVAVAWSDPDASGFDAETMLEAFYRIQLTETFELSPDIQLVQNQNDDLVTVLGLRLRTNF